MEYEQSIIEVTQMIQKSEILTFAQVIIREWFSPCIFSFIFSAMLHNELMLKRYGLIIKIGIRHLLA